MAWRWRALGIFVFVACLYCFHGAIAQGTVIPGSYGGGYEVSKDGVDSDGVEAVLLEDSFLSASPGMTTSNIISCKRFVVPGLSRFHSLKKLAHVRRVKLSAPPTLSKIEACFHDNRTYNLCQCPQTTWTALEKNKWSKSLSPFVDTFIDIRSDRKASIKDTLVTISVKQEFSAYRVLFFVVGIALLISAPRVSEFVPFYYGSGMTLGIILVVLIIMFQVMKLLPFGRKGSLYILIYGTLVGFGALIIAQITQMLAPLFKELGMGDDMVTPIAILCLLGILTLGAYLGFLGVRKFILSSDGTVDSGTALFVKWAIRLFGVTMLLYSSADTVFSLLALLIGVSVSLVHFKGIGRSVSSISWPFSQQDGDSSAFDAWRYRKQQLKLWKKKRAASPSTSYHTPVTISGKRVFVSPPANARMSPDRTYYSTYHHTPERKRMSREENDAVTREFTQSAMKELLSSPEFTEWASENMDRIALLPLDAREERPEEEIELTASMSS